MPRPSSELTETTAALQAARADNDQARQALVDTQRRFDELQTTVDQLRADLAASNEGADEALTQARTRIGELRRCFADERHAAQEAAAGRPCASRRSRVRGGAAAGRGSRVADTPEDDALAAGQRLDEAHEALAQAQARFEAAQSRDRLAQQALHDERDRLQAENTALQQRLAAVDESADEGAATGAGRLQQVEAQVVDMQRMAEAAAADHDRELLQLRAELSDAAVRAEQALTAAQEQAQVSGAAAAGSAAPAAENATLQAGIAEGAAGAEQAEGQLRAEARAGAASKSAKWLWRRPAKSSPN